MSFSGEFGPDFPSGRHELFAALERLHAEVDAACGRLEIRHAQRLSCARGCNTCCVDRLTVFPIEAELIRLRHAGLLLCGSPHPHGACAFLDGQGGCRVYLRRPYVCRTQGLPLRWFAEDDSGSTVEYRDICPLNDDPGAPVEELQHCDCWSIGPFEQRLATLQHEFAAGEMGRIELRSLFGHTNGY